MWILILLLICTVHGARASSDALHAIIGRYAAKLQPWLVSVRRELHQWPELMYQEFNTSAKIRTAFGRDGRPLQVRRHMSLLARSAS